MCPRPGHQTCQPSSHNDSGIGMSSCRTMRVSPYTWTRATGKEMLSFCRAAMLKRSKAALFATVGQVDRQTERWPTVLLELVDQPCWKPANLLFPVTYDKYFPFCSQTGLHGFFLYKYVLISTLITLQIQKPRLCLKATVPGSRKIWAKELGPRTHQGGRGRRG